MTRTIERHHRLGPIGKLFGLTLFVLLLALGLVGLVLPIIPGILFLLLAIYVLTRISGRFSALAKRNSWLRKSFRRLGTVRSLPAADLLKLSLWVTARSILNGIAALTGKVTGTTETARGGS